MHVFLEYKIEFVAPTEKSQTKNKTKKSSYVKIVIDNM